MLHRIPIIYNETVASIVCKYWRREGGGGNVGRYLSSTPTFTKPWKAELALQIKQLLFLLSCARRAGELLLPLARSVSVFLCKNLKTTDQKLMLPLT